MYRFVSIEELHELLNTGSVSAKEQFGKPIQADSETEFAGQGSYLFAFTGIGLFDYDWTEYCSYPVVELPDSLAIGTGNAIYRRYSVFGDYDAIGGCDERKYGEAYFTEYSLDDVMNIQWVENEISGWTKEDAIGCMIATYTCADNADELVKYPVFANNQNLAETIIYACRLQSRKVA